jgi:hypothetical protein
MVSRRLYGVPVVLSVDVPTSSDHLASMLRGTHSTES